VQVIRSLDPIPYDVLGRLIGAASGPFSGAVSALRGATANAVRAGAGAAQSLENAVGSVLRAYTSVSNR